MTNLQLEYAKLLENARHSREMERQGNVDLDIKLFSTSEQQRHNLATEGLSANDLAEKIRHQKAQDAQAFDNYEEAQRHNLAMEAQAKADNDVKIALARLNRQNVLDQIQSQQDIAKWKNTTDKEIAGLSRALNRYKIDTEKLLKQDELDISRDRVVNEAQKISADIETMRKNAESNYMNARSAQRQAEIASRNASTQETKVENERKAALMKNVIEQEKVIVDFLGSAKDAGGVLAWLQAL